MAGDIYNKENLVAQRLEDMGKTLATTTDKYNKTVTALVGKQGLAGKVDRFRAISAKATAEPSKLSPQHPSVEHDRLRSITDDRESADGGSSTVLPSLDELASEP